MLALMAYSVITTECALTAQSIYKPSFEMEWRVSPVQGKKLCRVTIGAGGTTAFPGEIKTNKHTLYVTFLIDVS